MMKLRYSCELLLFALVLLLASCISEDDSNCVQCSVTPSATDSTGKAIPAAVKGNTQAYLFIGGKFDRIVTAEADGSYKITYDGSQGTASLVTIGASSRDSMQVFTPAVGDDIGSMAVSVKRDSLTGEYLLPSSLYYGVYSYDSQLSGSKTAEGSIVMLNKPASVRVVIRQLKEFYGEGSYKVVLSGFRSTMTFAGEITGDAIQYTPSFTYDSSNELVTDAVRTLPSKTGEHITVSVYRSDASRAADSGTLVWSTEYDVNGKYVSLNSGDDKVLIVDCGMRLLNMTVVPWSDYAQHVVIP